MKNNLFLKQVVAVTALLPCLMSGQANAALTSRDLVIGSGDGLLTYDDQTNFEWLDVTQTLNMSFNQVVGELSTSGAFAGFNLASDANLQALFASGGWSGASNVNYSNDPDRFNEASVIVSLLGRTTINYSVNSTYGMVSDVQGSKQYYGFMYSYSDAINPYHSSSWHNNFSQARDVPSDYIGTFLYRVTTAVPEPETYALMLAGLGLIGFRMRKQPI